MSSKIRHCSICSSTSHTKTKCDAKEKRAVAAAAAVAATAAAEREAFASKSVQDQLLTLYDMILALRKSSDETNEELRAGLRMLQRDTSQDTY